MIENNINEKLYVLKRDGREEPIFFDKITSRIQKLCYKLNMDFIDPPALTLKVINELYPGIKTVDVDDVAAKLAAALSNEHPDYATLAARIEISNLHKETKKSFSELTNDLFNHNRVSMEYHKIVMENADVLNSSIIYNRDFSYSYFGFKVLESTYLKKIDKKVVERPQQMLMRISVCLHQDDIDATIQTYNLLSERWYMHTPQTMKEAGIHSPQLISGFSLSMSEDSIEGIYGTLKKCGLICRSGGKTGLNIHCIRGMGSYIAGTNGTSNGIVPMLRVYNAMARLTHQGRKKETANLMVYLEPWHSDIFEFINLKRQGGKEELRARDINYALWIPDLFMKKVEEGGEWSLMCPHKCSNLFNTYGEEFEKLYKNYENEGLFVKKVKARDLWFAILECQIECGFPSMMFKDHCNRKSNQKNLGTISGSNYTGDIMAFSQEKQAVACGSATVSLDMYVKSDKTFDFEKLKSVVKVILVNLDKMIDVTSYPDCETEEALKNTRPVAIGVQGLADTFIIMGYPYYSPEAKLLNKQIFETIYFAALESSCELARKVGPYSAYQGSPISQGILQCDMWNIVPTNLHDWDTLRSLIDEFGVRNSLLTAIGPTASTARIHGCNESIGPYTSNMQTGKNSLEGLDVINPHLLTHLTSLDVFDTDMWNEILENDGSVQNIQTIPEDVKDLYKTVWEMPQKTILEMTVDRGAFIDQSQSVNIHMVSAIENIYAKLTAMHVFAWKQGLKTGLYQLKVSITGGEDKPVPLSRSVSNQSQASTVTNEIEQGMAQLVCSLENRDECLSCGS